MIVAEQKPIDEILKSVENFDKILILGCNTCVAVCMAGGEKEVGILASLIRLAREKEGRPIEILEKTVERQCDDEFLLAEMDLFDRVPAILSTACGVGVQQLSALLSIPVLPALNTKFMGGTKDHCIWSERCAGCGDCILELTGGICPITRCAKGLLNGPCGGSSNGKCEVNPDTDCAWQLIIDRMTSLGQLDKLMEIQPPKNWQAARDGGPRTVTREDVKL
ncbi:MAG: methylenetetrahydrofolate reductase C-terminal domain-containing protein [Candidatus Eremiobacteraeota bacterium]|nr:methylenetetrahydrofolate reductase C-terminal domain-containing protein [Candidatus Eremiobacteraeota bacterium]